MLRPVPPGVANLLGMARCENCGAELQPQWKFCVRCGTKVAATATPPAPAPHVEQGAEPPLAAPIVELPLAERVPARPAPDIPAAIRPHELDGAPEPPARQRFDWHVLVGVLVGVAGAAAIVYVIVALTSGGGGS